jgi:hypothetical protein
MDEVFQFRTAAWSEQQRVNELVTRCDQRFRIVRGWAETQDDCERNLGFVSNLGIFKKVED